MPADDTAPVTARIDSSVLVTAKGPPDSPKAASTEHAFGSDPCCLSVVAATTS